MGVVLFSFSILFGTFLRLYDLDSVSPWSDEVSSWFYLRHLDLIFSSETHSPFYYSLLRLILGEDATVYGIRLVSALMSLFHLSLALFLGRKIFSPNQLLLFCLLIFLNPADIVYARMGRHYAWFLESVLLFILWLRIKSPTWWLALVAFGMGFLHAFAVIPIAFFMAQEWRENRQTKRSLVVVLSSFGFLLYSLSRLLVLGKEKVVENLIWNETSTFEHILSVAKLFLGEAWPRNQFFPVPLTLSLLVLGVSLAWLFDTSRKSFLNFLSLVLISFTVGLVISQFGVNLQVDRYFIFLIPVWMMALVDSSREPKNWILVLMLLLSSTYLVYLKPLVPYAWDDETVEIFRAYAASDSSRSQLICASRAQNEYYQLNAPLPCLSAVQKMDRKKPLIFLDLSGNDRLTMLFLNQEMNVLEHKKINHSRIILFEPR